MRLMNVLIFVFRLRLSMLTGLADGGPSFLYGPKLLSFSHLHVFGTAHLLHQTGGIVQTAQLQCCFSCNLHGMHREENARASL